VANVVMQGRKWTVRYRCNGAQRRHSLPLRSSRRDAERLAREIQHTIDTRGSWEPLGDSAITLGGLHKQYVAERTAAGARPATLRGYEVIGRFVDFARGRARVATIDRLARSTVTEWLATIREGGVTPTTIANYGRKIGAWWRWAYDTHPDDVPRPHMPKIRAPRPPVVRAPTWEQIDAMIAGLEGGLPGRSYQPVAVRRAVLLQRYTGLRVGQASQLRWANIDADLDGHGPAINISPALAKTEQEAHANRWIPVHADLHRLLLEWRMADGRPEEGLICGEAPRDLHDTVNGAWSRTETPADRYKGHPTHCIRKRLISHMVEQGISDAAIDLLVGHSPKGVRTRHYVDPLALFPVLKAAVATVPSYQPREKAKAV
jgi:integrase